MTNRVLNPEHVSADEKKAELAGKKQAQDKFTAKSVQELQRAYLQIEKQAERTFEDSVQHAFLWGALDQIRDMLEEQGESLPRKELTGGF